MLPIPRLGLSLSFRSNLSRPTTEFEQDIREDMAVSVHTAITTGSDILASAAAQTSGGIKATTREVQVLQIGQDHADPKSRPKSKYRHIAAAHKTSQPSCLSHEGEVSPSFIGFRNLMVLVISMQDLN